MLKSCDGKMSGDDFDFDCSVGILKNGSEHSRNFYSIDLHEPQNSTREETVGLIDELQREVAKRIAELCQAREDLHLAQDQVSSLSGEIEFLQSSILQERIDQLKGIGSARNHLLQLYECSRVQATGVDQATAPPAKSTESEGNRTFSSSKTSVVGPVLQRRTIHCPVGPIKGCHLDKNFALVPETDMYLISDSLSTTHTSKPSSMSTVSTGSHMHENVRILRTEPEGKYIQLRNISSNRDMDISNCRLQQNILSHPSAVFRFPVDTKIPALDTVTVWAEGARPSPNIKPNEFVFVGLLKWGTGPNYTVTFYGQNGQVLDSWTPAKGQLETTVSLQAKIHHPNAGTQKACFRPLTSSKIQGDVWKHPPNSRFQRPLLTKSVPTKLRKP